MSRKQVSGEVTSEDSKQIGVLTMPKKVHFTPPSSPENFGENCHLKKSYSFPDDEPQSNYCYLIMSVSSLLIGCVAVGGCVFFYFELMDIHTKFEQQRTQIFGITNKIKRENGKNFRSISKSGWIDYLQNRTHEIEIETEKIKKWIAFSGCAENRDLLVKYVE